MTFKPSKLAQLVVAYEAHFGTQVPIEAIKTLQVIDLVSLIQGALATNAPLAETGWTLPTEFSPRGCIMDIDTPKKLPSGDH
jgi:hypothetical protein